MKKFIFSFLSLSLVVVAASSCSKIYTGSTHEARIYEPTNTTPLTRPLTAEVEAISKNRIQDKWTFDLTPSRSRKMLRKSADLPYELKVKALAKSSNKHNADMILAATFDYEQEIRVKGIGAIKSNVITITVSGYPAKFTNWAPVSEENGDYKWIEDFYGKKFGWEKKCKKEESSTSNVNVTINTDKK